MAQAFRVTVATTATRVDAAAAGDHIGECRITILNPTGGQSVFLGGSAVTTAAGYELVSGASKDFDLEAGETLYGIVTATTQVVHILRIQRQTQ